jgi:hypothetical protein
MRSTQGVFLHYIVDVLQVPQLCTCGVLEGDISVVDGRTY